MQNAQPGFTLFEVQNIQQIRLFNADCSTPRFSYTKAITNGQASIEVHLARGAKVGDLFIVSVKYATDAVVGQATPAGLIEYSFETAVDGKIVDFDPTGLFLRSK